MNRRPTTRFSKSERAPCEYGPNRGALGTGSRREQKRAIERARIRAIRNHTRLLHASSRLGITIAEYTQKLARDIAAERKVAALPPAVIEPGEPLPEVAAAPVRKPRKSAAKKAVEAPSPAREVRRAVDFNLRADKPRRGRGAQA